MLKYKHIEASREARLWLTQVVIPLVGMGGVFLASVPEARDAIKAKWNARKEQKKFTNL